MASLLLSVVGYSVIESSIEAAPWLQIQSILDSCYSRPPKNVFPLVLSGLHRRQRIWFASSENHILGMVMLSPHSKGGHLENLAVLPSERGKGIARALVLELLSSTTPERPTLVSITTRIPQFFEKLGFSKCGTLSDGSFAMMFIRGPLAH